MTDQEWMIVGLVAVVLILVCIIVVLVKNSRERNQYNRSSMSIPAYRENSPSKDRSQSQESQVYRSYPDISEKKDDVGHEEEEPEEDMTYPEQLEECRERVGKLIEALKVFCPIKVTENFDEDNELRDEGYMFSLIELTVDLGKVWVIFYPNEDCDVAALIFDQETPWIVVKKAKNIIDEFIGDDEPDSYPYDGEGYPAYIWNGGDCDDLRDDITKAAEKNPTWKGLLDQIDAEEEVDSGNDDDNTDPEQLKECQVRAYGLVMSLKLSYPIKITENFDEDMELKNEGYMFSLIELDVDQGRMWVIFYPNENCDVVALIFDQEVSWMIAEKVKGIIDEFVGDDEPESYSGNGYPAYIWGNRDPDDLRDDIAQAAEKKPIWEQLSKQF